MSQLEFLRENGGDMQVKMVLAKEVQIVCSLFLVNCYLLHAAPYLAGVLGVPEHPRNLGVQDRGET